MAKTNQMAGITPTTTGAKMSKLEEFIEEKKKVRYVLAKSTPEGAETKWLDKEIQVSDGEVIRKVEYIQAVDLRELGRTHCLIHKTVISEGLFQDDYGKWFIALSPGDEKIMQAMIQASEPEMIEHNCPVNGEMMIEKGKPCNWCG